MVWNQWTPRLDVWVVSMVGCLIMVMQAHQKSEIFDQDIWFVYCQRYHARTLCRHHKDMSFGEQKPLIYYGWLFRQWAYYYSIYSTDWCMLVLWHPFIHREVFIVISVIAGWVTVPGSNVFCNEISHQLQHMGLSVVYTKYKFIKFIIWRIETYLNLGVKLLTCHWTLETLGLKLGNDRQNIWW